MRDNIIHTALFVRMPFTIEDLLRPDQKKYLWPFVIEKTVTIAQIDYENLITDMCVDREFIEEHRRLCYMDKRGIFHCLLVRRRGKKDGVLIMSGGTGFPKYAAYYPGEPEDKEWNPTGKNDIKLL